MFCVIIETRNCHLGYSLYHKNISLLGPSKALHAFAERHKKPKTKNCELRIKKISCLKMMAFHRYFLEKISKSHN